MTNEQFEQLKQDPTLTLKFDDENQQTIDNLYLIYFRVYKQEKCTEEEKQIYGVDFKKVWDRTILIEVFQEFREDQGVNLIYTVSPCSKSGLNFGKRPFFFKDFESARNFATSYFQSKN